MTKEELFKTYLEDPLLTEKNYITQERIDNLKFITPCSVKLIEVIRIAINGNIEDESESAISRKLNKYLNIQH